MIIDPELRAELEFERKALRTLAQQAMTRTRSAENGDAEPDVDPVVKAAVEMFGAEIPELTNDSEEIVLTHGDEELHFMQFAPPQWPLPRSNLGRDLFVSGYSICIRNAEAKAMLAEFLDDVDEQLAKRPDSRWWRRWVHTAAGLSIAGQLVLFAYRSLRGIRLLRWLFTPPA